MRRIVHQVSIIESLKDDLLFGLDYVFCFTWTTVQDFSIFIFNNMYVYVDAVGRSVDVAMVLSILQTLK
jgi:hypothetical protein